ncbi:MAG: hypothetical protein ABGX26_02965 [Nautiliaceae bacterium]
MDIKRLKHKILAILKYPYFFKEIIISNDVFTGGCGVVFVKKEKVMKVRIKNREEEIKKEIAKRGFLVLNSLEEEKEKFEHFNKKFICKLENNILTMPRIKGVSLESLIEEDDFFNYFILSIEKLINSNNYHGDFHPGNILIDNKEIYFIDFEYRYNDLLKNLEYEADVLKFIFYIKKYYTNFYWENIEKFRVIFNFFEKTKLIRAKNIMKNYLKDEIDEIFE